MKILYVEDNEDNIYMLKNRLLRAGFTVIVATVAKVNPVEQQGRALRQVECAFPPCVERLVARAQQQQQPERIRRVGVLPSSASNAPQLRATKRARQWQRSGSTHHDLSTATTITAKFGFPGLPPAATKLAFILPILQTTAPQSS